MAAVTNFSDFGEPPQKIKSDTVSTVSPSISHEVMRLEYQTIWPASWESYMQVRKQKLELDMEQQTGSK